MTTRVPIRYGGTGANTAPDARTALGVPPLAAYDVANNASSTANAAYSQANTAYGQANSAFAAANNRVLKAGDTMTGALNIACTAVSTSNTTGALIVGGGVGITGNTFSTGKLTIGNSIQHPNISSIVNQSAITGTTAYRPINLVDTSATIKIARVGSGDPAIEFQKWDANISLMDTRYDLAAGAAGSNTLAFREITGSTKWRFLIDANGYVAIGGGATAPVPTSNLHVFGNANITLGINTATVNATTINAQSFITSTGANVYSTALTAYAQANAAYDAANNAKVTVYANNNSNVTTQNVNFVNTATVTVTVTANGSNANIAFTAAPQTVVNDTYTAAGNTAAAATANIANGLFAISTNAYGQANAAYAQANLAYTAANNSNLLSGGSITGNLTISGNLVVQGNATTINVSNLSVNDSIILLSANATGDVGDIGFVGHFDRGATATHAGIVRIHALNEFQIFDNYEIEPTNNVIDIANYNYRLGNVRFNTLNANSVLILGNSVATQANLTLAHNQANDAYTAANNRVLKAGDTMTGSLLFNFSNSNVDIRQQSTNIASIEMGGAGGSLIDMKSPFSDDYDFRIITIQGSTEFLSNNAAQVVSFTGANVNFDAGTLFVDSVANEVGIGTTTPTAKLDIVDSVNDTEVLRVRTSGGNSGSVKGIAHLGLHYFSTGNNSPVRISVEEVDNADFRGHLLFSTRSTEDDTAPTERMRIDANGNVGIGITSPSKKLHVVGSTIIDDDALANNAVLLVIDDGVANTVTSSATFRIANDGTSPSFAIFEASSAVSNTVITNAGNMGIGTTTPAYKLDVVGVVRATGNVFVGTGAGTQAGDDNLIRPTSTNAFLNIKGGAGRAKFVLGNDGVVISSGTTDQIAFYTNAAATTTGTERMRIDLNGNVSIGTTSTTYKLEVNGSFAATTKSFVINHPTKPGMKLRYGSLEGPENGVYVRGKLTGNVIELPDYWTGLVDSDSITVNLTPIGKYQKLFIEKIEDNKVYVASENWFGQINCYYTVFAERKDVEKLVVEY